MDLSYGVVLFKYDSDNRLQFLLVEHARTGFWDIPKGHPEGEETPEQTAQREVRDETGYSFQLEPPFRASMEYVLPRGEDKRVTFYLGSPLDEGGGLTDPREIVRMAWLTPEEARRCVSFDNSREVLLRAEEFIEINRDMPGGTFPLTPRRTGNNRRP